MTRKFAASLLFLLLPLAATAGPREDLLARYAGEAKAADGAFAGFSAARGEALHTRQFAGGKADTPSCTACHARDPLAAGRTLAGKTVEPMAVSASPNRYTDAAKVEKWFKRNCNEVLGRPCTSLEKGDWLSYMASR